MTSSFMFESVIDPVLQKQFIRDILFLSSSPLFVNLLKLWTLANWYGFLINTKYFFLPEVLNIKLIDFFIKLNIPPINKTLLPRKIRLWQVNIVVRNFSLKTGTLRVDAVRYRKEEEMYSQCMKVASYQPGIFRHVTYARDTSFFLHTFIVIIHRGRQKAVIGIWTCNSMCSVGLKIKRYVDLFIYNCRNYF